MERSLLFVSLLIGVVCWLGGFLTARPPRSSTAQGGCLPRPYLITAFALPVLVFLATLPGRAPYFAAGHGFGNGFLLGGAGALLAGWTILRAYRGARSGEPAARAAAVAAPVALTVAVTVLPLLWMRDTVLDALSGIAIGWLCITFLLLFAMRQSEESIPQNTTPAGSVSVNPSAYLLAMTASAGFTVLLCAMSGLGEMRDPVAIVGKPDSPLHWSSAGMALAAGVSFLLLITSLPHFISMRLPLASLFAGWISRAYQSEEDRRAAAQGGRILFCVLALIALGKLLAGRYADDTETFGGPKSFFLLKPVFWFLGSYHLFHVLFLGMLAGLMLWWITSGRIRQEQDAASVSPPGWQNSALGILLLAGAVMVAFQLMGGFGIGIALTAAWPVAALALATAIEEGVETTGHYGANDVVSDYLTASTPQRLNAPTPAFAMAAHLTRILLFGILLLLYRLFEARFESELRGVNLTDHYALFGFLFGAMLPPVLAGFLLRMPGSSHISTGGRLLRIVLAGVLALLLPTIVLTLWGAKCALALLIGLALSVAITETSLLPALFALAVGLALTQWTHHVLPLSQLTRDQKTHALFVGGIIILLLILVADYGGRLLEKGKGGKTSPAARPAPGGTVQ